jgi:hypothetical protein
MFWFHHVFLETKACPGYNFYTTTIVPFYKTVPSTMKEWPNERDGLSWKRQFSSMFYYLNTAEFDLKRRMVSLEKDNLVVFNYLCASEIWSNKRGSLWWEWSYTRGWLLSGEVFCVSIDIILVTGCYGQL